MDDALSLLPLVSDVVFPDQNTLLFVGQERSLAAVKAAVDRPTADGTKLFVCLRRSSDDYPAGVEDLHPVGTLCSVRYVGTRSDGLVALELRGDRVARLRECRVGPDHLEAGIELVDGPEDMDPALLDPLHLAYTRWVGKVADEVASKATDRWVGEDELHASACWLLGQTPGEEGAPDLAEATERLADYLRGTLPITDGELLNVSKSDDLDLRVQPPVMVLNLAVWARATGLRAVPTALFTSSLAPWRKLWMYADEALREAPARQRVLELEDPAARAAEALAGFEALRKAKYGE